MSQYRAFNGPSPTTAGQVAVTTGTAIKTMLQIATPSTNAMKIKAWGVSMDGSAAAAGIQWELLTTGAVAATVTAHVAAGLVAVDYQASLANSAMTLGTAATGYTASAEGTITSTRVIDAQKLQPTGAYIFQWPLGDEPRVFPSTFLRVRCIAPAAVNALCWVLWEE